MDFGNAAYLDYVMNTWMPDDYLDSTDDDPNKLTFYLQDNGNFRAMAIECASSGPASYLPAIHLGRGNAHCLESYAGCLEEEVAE